MYSSNMLWRDKSSNIICFPKKIKEGAPIVDGGQEVSTASDLFPRVDHEIISVTHAGSSRPSTRRRRWGEGGASAVCEALGCEEAGNSSV